LSRWILKVLADEHLATLTTEKARKLSFQPPYELCALTFRQRDRRIAVGRGQRYVLIASWLLFRTLQPWTFFRSMLLDINLYASVQSAAS